MTDTDIAGKLLLVRADLNVPMQGGQVGDKSRINRLAAGLNSMLDRGARAVIISHFGRPQGRASAELSLKPVAGALAASLGRPVSFGGEASAAPAREMAQGLSAGEVMLCENVRFDPREETNSMEFAAELARLGEIYVNDAFSCAHRAHASTEAVAHILPSFAGPLMCEEIAALEAALEAPEKPALAVVGGAKVSSKIAVLRHLVGKLDALIVGGGMANTFLLADGVNVGASLCEADQLGMVAEVRALAEQSGCEIIVPEDIVYGMEFSAEAEAIEAPLSGCPEKAMILDVGRQSLSRFCEVLGRARTLLWNGPLGAFELPNFANGTMELARYAEKLTREGRLKTIAGGGDTVAALNMAGVTAGFTYVSTAGGAFLEWLEGKELPGVAALRG